jgi:hypothetical protein
LVSTEYAPTGCRCALSRLPISQPASAWLLLPATAAAAAAAATTTAAATTAAATTTAAAATAVLALFGLVHAQRTAVEARAVERRNGVCSFSRRAHGHEGEAARLTTVAVLDNVHVGDFTAGREGLAHTLGRGRKGQITYVETISHAVFSIRSWL